MESILGLRTSKHNSSPLEGSGAFRALQAESGLRQIARREWWLWFSAFFVATLSAAAFLLSSFPFFFRNSEHFYEIRSDQARWGILSLLLLFNGWMLYRQWSFRRQRKQLSGQNAGADGHPGEIPDPSGVDPVTGLHTRVFIEQQLGKEIAHARRQNTALSLATVHLDEFAEINKRYGQSATDEALKELARRLKKACRGSDFAARLASDDFLLVLPILSTRPGGWIINLATCPRICSSAPRNFFTFTKTPPKKVSPRLWRRIDWPPDPSRLCRPPMVTTLWAASRAQLRFLNRGYR